MPRGVLIKLLRKAGAFDGGELAAGELGVDTSAGQLQFSPDGTAVVTVPKTPVAQEVAFSWTGDGAATYRAAVACTLSSPGLDAGGTATVAYEYKPPAGAFAAATFPVTMAAGGVFRATLSGFSVHAAWSCVRA